MSLDKLPLITKLLRAARDGNELLLENILNDIIINGIDTEELNATDQSGRTTLSYICSTNSKHLLELILRVKGLDINKSDNEGNTPLHFAAQAGLSEIVNTLLSKSRSIKVDAKNNLGFTPLMKAALQGRIRCAKIILLAGGSALETDYGRGLRPEQWARFCGRYSCAEMIETCSRARLLSNTTKSVPTTQNNNKQNNLNNKNLNILDNENIKLKSNKINLTNSESFRSKLLHALPPFKYIFSNDKKGATGGCVTQPPLVQGKKRDKAADATINNDKTEIITYLTAAALATSGPALPNRANKKILNNLLRPLEVPKLEVTLAITHC